MEVTLTEAARAEIKAEIARRGLSQSVVAKAWRISQPSTSAKLSGRTELSADDIDRAARALGYDPFDFIERAKRNASYPQLPTGAVAS
ncbi:helix-turn-helix domain-containing protein [Leifsonia xyli]